MPESYPDTADLVPRLRAALLAATGLELVVQVSSSTCAWINIAVSVPSERRRRAGIVALRKVITDVLRRERVKHGLYPFAEQLHGDVVGSIQIRDVPRSGAMDASHLSGPAPRVNRPV